MKHLHMLMAFITILLFLWQSYLVISQDRYFGKKGKIATHVIYTLLIGSGLIILMPLLSLNVPLQWVAAKIILLVAAVSASIKAFRPTTRNTETKVGIFIALAAYIGIVVLAFVKPVNFI